MAKVNTNITLDPDLKQSAQILFSDLGLDLSTAITLFLKQAVREQSIPFVIRKRTFNKETLDALSEFEEMKHNKEKYKRYTPSEAIKEFSSWN